MKKNMFLILIIILSIVLVSCGGADSFKDGTYVGEYKGSDSSKTVVTLTIKDNKIVDCALDSYDKKGELKDENYGKDSGDANYAIAQKALESMKKYPKLLIETQNIDDVEAVSGATITYKEFKEAVKEALNNAKE